MERVRTTLSNNLPSTMSGLFPSWLKTTGGRSHPHHRLYSNGQADESTPMAQFPPKEWSQGSHYSYSTSGIPTPAPFSSTPYTASTATFAHMQSAAAIARPAKWTPPMLSFMVLVPVAVMMLGLAGLVEYLHNRAEQWNGFSVSAIERLGAVQFIDSFVPVVIALPFAVFWRFTDFEVMRLQPFIELSHGHAPPETSVLLDYVSLGKLWGFIAAISNRHWFVFISASLYMITLIFQPIAAALFIVRSTRVVMPDETVDSLYKLGLQPDFLDLNAFVAAAGYAEAAVVHGLGDPPFVKEGWSIAPFDVAKVLKDTAKNGTVSVNTTATEVSPNCQVAQIDPLRQPDGTYIVTGTFGGCSGNFTAEQDVTEHFGAFKVDNCQVRGQILQDRYKPVMFWYFETEGALGFMAFCQPSLKVYSSAAANVTLFNATLSGVTPYTDWVEQNTVVLPPPLDGLMMNGLFFDGIATDKFTTARATALQNILPGAMFRLAQRQFGSVTAALTHGDGLLDITEHIYTRYLAIAAKSNFFQEERSTRLATIDAWQPRLWMDTFATHVFAGLFIFVAVAAVLLHVLHHRERKLLRLAGPPGSIASAVSLTSSARFGAILNAGDTDKALKQKLRNLRFGIDKDTWQIVVESELLEDQEKARAGQSKKTSTSSYSDHHASTLSHSTSPSMAPYRDSVLGTVQRDSVMGGVQGTAMSPHGATFGFTSPAPSPRVGAFGMTSPGPTSPRFAGYVPPDGPPPSARYHDPYGADRV